MPIRDKKILNAIDKIYTDNSEYGYRMIHRQLLEVSKYPAPKIFNADQGSQYTSYEHTQLLKQHNIQISMNGKGRSIDNIAIERFFRTLKHGNIYISDYKTIKELKEGVKAYIHKYNFKRFHSSINYQKPMNLYLEKMKLSA
jgi:putative transposase